MNTNTRTERCDYVIRRAGETPDGRPLGPSYGGDITATCGQPGHPESYTLYVGRRREPTSGTRTRCAEHRATT